MQQQQPQQPAVSVSAPILLKILTIVKKSQQGYPEVLPEIIDGEINELIRMLEYEVLTPKWAEIVKKEVSDYLDKSTKAQLKAVNDKEEKAVEGK